MLERLIMAGHRETREEHGKQSPGLEALARAVGAEG